MTTSEGVVKPDNRTARQHIKGLERELRCKDAVLAETAALLVSRKKAEAIRGESEDVSPLSDRYDVLRLLDEAVAAGARLAPACAMLELRVRTYSDGPKHLKMGGRRRVDRHQPISSAKKNGGTCWPLPTN